jgi:hypothetical protein
VGPFGLLYFTLRDIIMLQNAPLQPLVGNLAK